MLKKFLEEKLNFLPTSDQHEIDFLNCNEDSLREIACELYKRAVNKWKESSEKSSSGLDFLIDFNKHLIDLHGSNKQPPRKNTVNSIKFIEIGMSFVSKVIVQKN